MADPLTVTCPDCAVPAGTPCAMSIGYLTGSHAERQRVADLRAVEHGTCALCGQPMVYGAIEDRDPVAWHPDPTDAAACPPIPDPGVDPAGWSLAVNLGLSPGHPGNEHFRPDAQDPDTDAAGVPLADQPPGTWERADYEGGDPDTRSYAQRERDALTEQGRVLASEREDLVAAGADPADLQVPLAPGPICPECTAGKHPNCDGTAWDLQTDAPAPCACHAAGHPGSTP